MNQEIGLGGQGNASSRKETADHADINAHTTPAYKMLTHNERIVSALSAIREGKLGPYEKLQFSCSYYENPIQAVLRNKETGRLRIANIDDWGCVAWDNDAIPWYKACH